MYRVRNSYAQAELGLVNSFRYGRHWHGWWPGAVHNHPSESIRRSSFRHGARAAERDVPLPGEERTTRYYGTCTCLFLCAPNQTSINNWRGRGPAKHGREKKTFAPQSLGSRRLRTSEGVAVGHATGSREVLLEDRPRGSMRMEPLRSRINERMSESMRRKMQQCVWIVIHPALGNAQVIPRAEMGRSCESA